MAQPNAEKKKGPPQERPAEALIRIHGQDIVSSKNIYTGLTKIKGVSWSIANALCITLNIDKAKKIKDLSKEEITTIETTLKNLDIPNHLKNRQHDRDSGEHKHLLSNDLDMRKEFDIKRLKKIKSYRGNRHTFKLPVRGQRTRSNFRSSGIAVGVKRKK